MKKAIGRFRPRPTLHGPIPIRLATHLLAAGARAVTPHPNATVITTATRLTTKERAALSALLDRELTRAMRASARVQLSGDRAADPLDEASLLAQQESDAALSTRSAGGVQAIIDAQRRLRDEPAGFAVCTGCGGGIPFARLEVVPTATRCISCA